MKLKKFKLNLLSADELQQKEMSAILGGQACTCSCYYEGSGGSSSYANSGANYSADTTSTCGCNQWAYDGTSYSYVHTAYEGN